MWGHRKKKSQLTTDGQTTEKTKDLPIVHTPWKCYLPLLLVFIVSFVGIAWILIEYTDSNVPWLDSPVYIRMGRLDVETIFDEETYDFQIGIANTVREGNDVTIASTGLMTYEAIKAADILAAEGISVRVINVGTIKPLDGETILKAAKETKFIITAEEHSVIGGLGSAVSEFLSEVYPTKVKKLGIYDKFGQSGKAAELLEKYELTAAKLVAMVKENM